MSAPLINEFPLLKHLSQIFVKSSRKIIFHQLSQKRKVLLPWRLRFINFFVVKLLSRISEVKVSEIPLEASRYHTIDKIASSDCLLDFDNLSMNHFSFNCLDIYSRHFLHRFRLPQIL